MDGLCLKFSGQSRTHSRPLQVEDGAMREFISKYADRIHGVLSCFDRMLFRGYLPIRSGWQMAQFFNNSNIRYRELKPFLLEHAAQVKQHGVDLAQKEGRRFQYLQEKVRKEELAGQIAERDHIEDGLICVLSVLEPCRTFSFRTEKGKPFVASARRKCLFLYYYFMDRDYWVTAQSEYSTDILFKSASHLSELYPRLLSHSTLCFGAKEVMSFLGKKIRSQFEGEVVTDVSDLSFKRIAGSRIKHRVTELAEDVQQGRFGPPVGNGHQRSGGIHRP